MADIFSMSFGVGPSQQASSVMLAQRESVYNSLDTSTIALFDTLESVTSQYVNLGTQDQIDRCRALINGVVDSMQVCWANSTFDLQTANHATGRLLMAMPAMEVAQRLGQVEAYGLEYKPVENEMLRTRLLSGFGGLNGKDHVVNWYADNAEIEGFDDLSQYSQMCIIRANNLALQAIAEDEDPTSCFGGVF